MRAFAGIAALALVAACHQAPAELTADGAWVRLPALRDNPGAAYFTLHGGSEPATLLAVSAPFAVRTELHESMEGHGQMMAMTPLKQVAVGSRTTVEFKPKGKHVMLFDVAPNVQAGERVPLTLRFADGKTIELKAIVVGAGDPEPRP
jgi:copper(I)-binding protein